MRDLCEELIGEILDRIPIKQVIRIKCLSKSWFRLIVRYRESKRRLSSSTFLLQYKIPTSHQVLFLQAKEQPHKGGNVMDKLLGHPMDKSFNFMGFSNGLFLFNQFVHPEKLIIYVCNPAAKVWQWNTLPPLLHWENSNQSIFIGMGLAFDGVPDHPYKVICYTDFRWNGDLEYQIYSSDTREWQTHITRIPHSSSFFRALIIRSPHLFWKGMLLCIVRQESDFSVENLLVYHIQNNSFKVMTLPKKDELQSHGGGFLWESEGYLRYCQNIEDGFCVWKYVDCNVCWETFTSDTGKWNLVHIANIRAQVAQHPEVYGPTDVHKEKISATFFEPCAFDEDLQLLYILLPTTIISYSFETQRLSKVWTIEDSRDLFYSAPRALSIQLNGKNYPLGGDSVLSLPEPEPQGAPIED